MFGNNELWACHSIMVLNALKRKHIKRARNDAISRNILFKAVNSEYNWNATSSSKFEAGFSS